MRTCGLALLLALVASGCEPEGGAGGGSDGGTTQSDGGGTDGGGGGSGGGDDGGPIGDGAAGGDQGAADALPPDEEAPVVFFRAPLEGETVEGDVEVQVEATDDRGVARVVLYVDGDEVATLESAPYAWTWSTAGLTAGPYRLGARAFDAAGNEAYVEAQVRVRGTCNADGDCPPQSVRIITPVGGSRVCGNLTVEATATDDNGIARMEFRVDDIPLGVTEEAPFRFEWDTTAKADGDYTLTAIAQDTVGQRAFASVRVTVRNDGDTCDNLPNVAITTPVNNAFVNGPIEVAANAADDVGVVKVDFFIDNGRVAEDDSVPYRIEWNTDDFEEGAHSLKAIAHDTGEQTAENQVQVTVDRTPPTVELVAPGDGEHFVDEVLVEARPEDNFAVDRVELVLEDDDGFEAARQTVEEAPWETTFDVSEARSGFYTLHAVVHDRAGLQGRSNGVEVLLDRPPTVSFTNPEDGDTLDGPTTIRWNADDDRGLDSAVLSIDGQARQADPFDDSHFWEPPYRRGNYTLRVEVTDRVGQTAADQIEVEVDHPLEVELQRCANGNCNRLLNDAEVSDELTLRAVTRDDDGAVERVEFFVDGDLVATDEAAPFEHTLDTVALGDGAHRLRVRAASDNGATAEARADVRVNNCDRDDDGFLADSDACAGSDCDDGDRLRNPSADDDVGDGADQNCDGLDGVDADGDGHASAASGGDDCDDEDGGRSPGLPDQVGNDTDENCDGVDGVDGDGDGFASEASGGDDCDDGDLAIHPGAFDGIGNGGGEGEGEGEGEAPRGDGIDQNCDGVDGVDGDGDGHASIASGGEDCGDADPGVHPCADDVAGDGTDQNCDGADVQSCDDCNGCTADSPNGAACRHVPIGEGQACDDEDACTEGERCAGGVCGDGDAVVCPDPGACQASFCDHLRGCDAAPVADGSACPGGSCVQGACCVPDCGGRACGDDGCGGSCGACGEGLVCQDDEVGGAACVEPPPALDGFVLIPAGEFVMGSPPGELGRFDDETQHRVRLTRSFWMGTTEVTQGEWAALMGNNPSWFANCGDDCPVENVTWFDAVAYANALSRSEGLEECYGANGAFAGLDCAGYRLPTEAEWEYAARAGTQTAFHSGNITRTVCALDPNLDAAGWYCGNSGDTTHPVAGKQPNAWGLFDVHGNVWEWVQDWYDDYPNDALTIDPIGPGGGGDRVRRGGSWSGYARFARAAFRDWYGPGLRNVNLGFRLARSNP